MNTLTKLKDGRLRAGLSAAALLVAFALAGCGKSGACSSLSVYES